MFRSDREAMQVLEDVNEDALLREKAAWYLQGRASTGSGRAVVHALVAALRDDDLGVEWAASESLAKLGAVVLPELVELLAHPAGARDYRLREVVHHMLHRMAAGGRLTPELYGLMDALHGPASDVRTLVAAHRFLLKMQAADRARLQHLA